MGSTGLTKLRHYRHLDKTEGRLRQLLRDFSFGTIREVLEREMAKVPQWQEAPQGVGALRLGASASPLL